MGDVKEHESLWEQAFEAYNEMECICPETLIDHSGDKRGYVVWHDCTAGFLCAQHYNVMLQQTLPEIRASLAQYGLVGCGKCNDAFSAADDLVKIYPL